MNEIIVQFSRPFQVWQYTVSHGQLLLRSTKAAGRRNTQVDVLFKNVVALAIPTSFDGLVVSQMFEQPDDSLLLLPRSVGTKDPKQFLVRGVDWKGLVIGGVVTWCEDDSDRFSDSKLMPTLN